MHVAERNRELERQRKQRQIRPQSRTRPEPTHRRHASRVGCRGRTILPPRSRALLQCNNADNWATLRFLSRVAKNQHCGGSSVSFHNRGCSKVNKKTRRLKRVSLACA